jgi:acyl transferase domain-containing protein
MADTSDSIARLVVFSTQDKAGIERITSKWKEFVQSQIDAKKKPSIRDLAHTMSMRRSQLPFRSFVVADSLEQLLQALDQGIPSYPRASRKTQSNIAFIFTGQGAQWAQMGVELLRIPVFAASIARSQAILSDCGCPWDLVDEIKLPSSDTRINQPEKSQPICCALQVALTDLLTTWQVLPKVTVGHSSGEIGKNIYHIASTIYRSGQH